MLGGLIAGIVTLGVLVYFLVLYFKPELFS